MNLFQHFVHPPKRSCLKTHSGKTLTAQSRPALVRRGEPSVAAIEGLFPSRASPYNIKRKTCWICLIITKRILICIAWRPQTVQRNSNTGSRCSRVHPTDFCRDGFETNGLRTRLLAHAEFRFLAVSLSGSQNSDVTGLPTAARMPLICKNYSRNAQQSGRPSPSYMDPLRRLLPATDLKHATSRVGPIVHAHEVVYGGLRSGHATSKDRAASVGGSAVAGNKFILSGATRRRSAI